MIILLTGLSGAGKSTLSHNVKVNLAKIGIDTEIIDGDEYREKICKDLTFSKTDRIENIRRLGFIASKFSSRGIIAIISVISPYDEVRRELADTYANLKIVHIDCPVESLVERDTKGLYKRALLPDGHPQKIYNLTGINDNYDVPAKPDLYINTHNQNLQESIHALALFTVNHYYKEKYASINAMADIPVLV